MDESELVGTVTPSMLVGAAADTCAGIGALWAAGPRLPRAPCAQFRWCNREENHFTEFEYGEGV